MHSPDCARHRFVICNMEHQIQQTEDGSITIYLPEIDEHYHSVHGAIQESLFVFVGSGLQHLSHNGIVRIFEVGFGTGLNALLTLDFALRNGIDVDYCAIEKYPLAADEYSQLNYVAKYPHLKDAFMLMHTAEWNRPMQISGNFTLTKISGDLVHCDIGSGFNLVYQDAFAPDKQPELWSEAIFKRLFDAMAPDGILVTYSAKGQVRRNMQNSGFMVERLPGPPGKREMLRAIKF